MNTLDRYIARQYLFNVIALLVLLFSFVVAVDVALNMDNFLKIADKALAATGQTAGTFRRTTLAISFIADLWWPRLLQLYTYMIGLVLVAAMGFTCTQLVRHREMVAVLAGGISLHRVARPILIVASVMMALKVIDHEIILSNPRIAPLLTRDNNDAGMQKWSDFPVRLVPDGANRVFLARKFEPNEGVLTDLTVWERDETGTARRQITAPRAVWRSGGWDLTDPVAADMHLSASGTPSGGQKIIAPTRIETDLNPGQLKFKRFAAYSQTLSWHQITSMLQNPTIKPEMHDRLQRVRWGRISTLISGLVALIISMPFFLVREPRNMLVQSLKCAPIGMISLMGGILGAAAPVPGLPAGFAVFLPVLILIPIAIATVSWVKT